MKEIPQEIKDLTKSIVKEMPNYTMTMSGEEAMVLVFTVLMEMSGDSNDACAALIGGIVQRTERMPIDEAVAEVLGAIQARIGEEFPSYMPGLLAHTISYSMLVEKKNPLPEEIKNPPPKSQTIKE